MSESIDLSLEDSNDEADMMERRGSLNFDDLQWAHEKNSVDSIMLEVIFKNFMFNKELIIELHTLGN